MCLIAKCSLKYKWPSWVVYDLNFRQDAADTGLKDWSKVDPSVYTQCFMGASICQESWCKSCHSIDHISENCPIKPVSNLRKWEIPGFLAPSQLGKRQALRSNPQPCKKYNRYNGDCRYADGCIFQHKCMACGEYGQSACRRKSNWQDEAYKPKATTNTIIMYVDLITYHWLHDLLLIIIVVHSG